jgi:hypothetical protein
MTMIASVGAPGMPSASMAGMQMILLAVGIPLEAIGLLLVVERPLDAIRTAVKRGRRSGGGSRGTELPEQESQQVGCRSRLEGSRLSSLSSHQPSLLTLDFR